MIEPEKAVFLSPILSCLHWQISKCVLKTFPTENDGSTQGLPHLIDKQAKSQRSSWVENACLKVISTLKSCIADASKMSRHSLIESKKSLIPYKNQCNVDSSTLDICNQFPMALKIDQQHPDNRRLSVLAMCLKVCSRSHKCP